MSVREQGIDLLVALNTQFEEWAIFVFALKCEYTRVGTIGEIEPKYHGELRRWEGGDGNARIVLPIDQSVAGVICRTTKAYRESRVQPNLPWYVDLMAVGGGGGVEIGRAHV